jgi:hypothetical protein
MGRPSKRYDRTDAINGATVGMQFDDAWSPNLMIRNYTPANVTTKITLSTPKSATVLSY